MNAERRTTTVAGTSIPHALLLWSPPRRLMSGALTAIGARRASSVAALLTAPVGAAIRAAQRRQQRANQIYDPDIDRVKKPKRPLPSGRLTIAQVGFTNITYALALVLAWLVVPGRPAPSAGGAARMLGWWRWRSSAPISIGAAVPHQAPGDLGERRSRFRAVLLGRRLVVGENDGRPRAATSAAFRPVSPGRDDTKDFATWDRRGGCRTLPIQHGVRRAAWMISRRSSFRS
jgi:hypothetical protein